MFANCSSASIMVGVIWLECLPAGIYLVIGLQWGDVYGCLVPKVGLSYSPYRSY